jgi:DNA-3-methyladenine glycosylase II
MNRIWIRKPLGFRVQALAEFYAGFVPGSGMASTDLGRRHHDAFSLGFRLDRSYEPVLVSLAERGEHLCVDIVGTADVAAVERQLQRVLGLDADSASWFDLGERDAVVGELQRAFPGFLSAGSASPYEAAVWAVLSPRMHQAQAARIKQALTREFGDTLELGGLTQRVFPSPERLSSLECFPGLSLEKVARLRGIAEAALRGRLDADYLLDLGEERALRELRTLRGVGAWAASHIFYRGAAPRDGLPIAEPRLLHAFSSAYRLRSPSLGILQRVGSSWRPFRLWMCVLLMRHLSDLNAIDGSPVWHPAPGMVSNPSSS